MVTRETIEAALRQLNAAENSRPTSTVEETSARIDVLMSPDVHGWRNGVAVPDRATERKAERIGFVNHVVPQSELLATAVEMGKQIAANSSSAVQWAKRVIDASTTIEAGWEVDAAANKALRGTTEQTARFKQAAERVTGRS